MNAEQYYQRHVQLHGGAPAASGSRDFSVLPPAPSEMDYALSWLAEEGIDGAILDAGCNGLTLLASVNGWFRERHGADIVRSPNWGRDPGICCQVCNFDEGPLPYAIDRFDAVTCLAVLEHVFDPYHLVRELRRVCKPAGRVVIGVPNVAGIKRRLELIRGKLPVTSTRYSFGEESWDGFHLHYFTQPSLEWLLRREGLAPVRWASAGRGRWWKQRWPSLLGNDLVVMARKTEPYPGLPFPR